MDSTHLAINVVEFQNLYTVRAPNIMWFLGAGTSVGAGLPTAATLTWELKRTLYCNSNKIPYSRFPDLESTVFRQTVQAFFDSSGGFPKRNDNAEYSEYFARVLPDEADRRRFLDDRLRGAKPSYGHLCLAALHALGKGRIIWTTNFDPLVERAFSAEPITEKLPGGLTDCGLGCPQKAQDSLNDERWPILIKLHGDYQFRRLRNTADELATQDAVLRKALVSQCKARGLAVTGYSGRDTSIMEALHEAINADSAFPHGLFWFVRHGTTLAESVLNLLAAAKSKGIQAGYVEVGGFDELMADLFLPYHEEVPAIRDVIKKQRSRREASPITYQFGRKWPVLRTNALEVFDYPSTCTLFQAKIGGMAEIKPLVVGKEKTLCVARRKVGLLAFGTRTEIESVFSNYAPSQFDRHSFDPRRLLDEDSAETGLLYHALIQGLANATGLTRSASNRGRLLFMSSHTSLTNDELKRLGQLGSTAVTTLRADATIHQAVRVSLNFNDQRLWLLLRPTLVVTSDGTNMYEGEDRADIGREVLIKRYNKLSNDWLVFWIQFFTSRCGTPIRAAFPDASRPEAVFQIREKTAYSRPR